ncbi:MAG TPA: hypothetical protein VFM18_18820 [Methanosarcina sp.]|nr:hypothetical protein [Methanosarcina sp.]
MKGAKIVTAVVIDGKSYRTAFNAAEAYASAIWGRMVTRHIVTLNKPAYYDPAFMARYEEVYEKAKRRTYPIFKQLFAKNSKRK